MKFRNARTSAAQLVTPPPGRFAYESLRPTRMLREESRFCYQGGLYTSLGFRSKLYCRSEPVSHFRRLEASMPNPRVRQPGDPRWVTWRFPPTLEKPFLPFSSGHEGHHCSLNAGALSDAQIQSSYASHSTSHF